MADYGQNNESFNGEPTDNNDLSFDNDTISNRVVVKEYQGKDSAIIQFFEVVQRLNNNHHDRIGSITVAAGDFQFVSEYLESANGILAGGWSEVASLCSKIDKKLQDILESLIVEMNRYAELANSGELEAIDSVNNSNTVTNSLLDELNLI